MSYDERLWIRQSLLTIEERRRFLTAEHLLDRSDCWERYFGNETSRGQPKFQKLVLRLFIAHENGSPLFKMEAAKLLPADNSVTAMKYLLQAQARGWVQFVADAIDRRRIQVVATPQILENARAYLTELIDLEKAFLKEVSEAEAPLS